MSNQNRRPSETERQIRLLQEVKPTLPKQNSFGEDNMMIIDLMILTLRNGAIPKEYEGELLPAEVYDCALWLQGKYDEDLYLLF